MTFRISLRLLIVLLLALVALFTTVISLVPLQRTAVAAVSDATQRLRVETRLRLSEQIEQFFLAPTNAVKSFQTLNRFSHDEMNSLDMIASSLRMIGLQFGVPCYIALNSSEFFYVNNTPPPAADVGEGGALLHVYPHNDSTSRFIDGYRINDENLTIVSNPMLSPYRQTTYNPLERPWWPTLLNGLSWTHVYIHSGEFSSSDRDVGFGAIDITVGVPIFDHSHSRKKIGAFGVDVQIHTLLKWLRGLAVGKSGRVALLEPSSQAVLGGNWESNMSILVDADFPMSTSSYRLTKLVDVTDSLFQQSVKALGDAVIFSAPTPYNHTFEDTNGDMVFVDIATISDAHGLDLRLVIITPERDFRVDIDTQMTISIAIIAGAVSALLIFSFVGMSILLHPLHKLEERMHRSSSLSDTAGSIVPSALSEIAGIQIAYNRLLAEMKYVKSFLPPSVVAAELDASYDEHHQEGSDNDDDVSPTEGSPDAAAAEDSHTQLWDIQCERATRSSRQGLTLDALRFSAENLICDERLSNVSPRSSAACSRKPRKHSSHKRGSSPYATPPPTRFNTEDIISSKSVTVMVCNLVGFQKTMIASERAGRKQLSRFLHVISESVKSHRGVIDSFHGDHVTILFNAILPAAGHQGRACKAAMQLLHQSQNDPDLPDVTIGLASGSVIAGHMGIEGLKRYCTVGDACTSAIVLERCCKQFSVPLLISPNTAENAKYDVYIAPVDIFRLPGENTPVTISTAVAVRQAAHEEEWMYNLDEPVESSKVIELVTEGFNKYVLGDTACAQRIVDDIPKDSDHSHRLRHALLELPSARLRRNLDSFYQAAFPPTQASSSPETATPSSTLLLLLQQETNVS